MPPPDAGGRQIVGTSAPHAQQFYAHLKSSQYARGIDGPLFTRQVCGGANMNGVLLNPDEFEGRNPFASMPEPPPWQSLADDDILQAWPGNPLGLNVRVEPPRKKGDAYRAGQHYKSKHDPELAPTGSTIAISGPVPGVANISGTEKIRPTKVLGFMGKTLGKRLGSYSADSLHFLKKHENHPPLAFPTRFHYEDENQRAPRPPRAAECVNNVVHRNEIDFVTKNKVENIMSEPDRHRPGKHNMTNRFSEAPSKLPQGILSPARSNRTELPKKTLTAEEMKLAETRRSDFEALLRGQDPKCEERKRRLAEIAVIRTELISRKENEAAAKSLKMASETQGESILPFQRPTPRSRAMTTMSHASAQVSEFGFEGRTVRRVPKDARRQLIRSLKQRWDEVNKEYQLLTLSLFNLDTVHKVTKKEACEELMMRLEKDIYRLSKGDLFLAVEDRPSTTK